MDAGVSEASPDQRVVRVFVSSTFRDMQAERDELVKRTFPLLRRLCDERGVVWGEVDLRWGITDEARAEGRVLPLCLAEIDRSRPYFVCFLGERYGWVADSFDEDLVAREPWLAEHLQQSVTELEILHGVLNNPAMAEHAFFYFREPGYVDTLPPETQAAYREAPTYLEVRRHGHAVAERRAAERRAKLQALKERIRASGFPVRTYADPLAVADLVQEDLAAIIDQRFPAGSAPEGLDREAAAHEAFASSRARVYIAREDDFARLDAHASGDGPPLVVVGESGVGKSALLANWALRFRASAVTVPPPKQPSMLGRLFGRDTGRGTDESAPPVLLHFTAASADATDWAKMLRRLIGELDRRLGTTGDVPDQPLELRAEFADRLHMAAARGRVVIVLDGLNQLEDREQALDLAWLPPEIPANVRLILSTLPSRPLDELSRRGWPVLKVEPLSQEDRRDLAARYLSQYAKSLSPAQLDRVAAAPQTANPLFLRALLDELRLHGIHETLDECIAGYLTADSIAALYQQILARWEVDYERERPGMVAEAMTLVWAAREGLSETELLDLLGAAGEPLPRAYWSPLFLAAESALLNRSGLLGFGHDYVRRAVIERYLADDSDQRTAHQRLADYFDERRETTRAVTELPWQLQEAGEWDRLARVLGAPEFFVRAWNAGRFETAGYWARIEGASSGRMVDAYRPITAAPHAFDLDTAWSVGLLLWDAGHLAPALSLYRTLGESYRASNNLDSLRGALGNQAMILRMQDDLEGALILLKEQEQLCRRLNDLDGLSRSLGNQALIWRLQGNPDQAMDLLTQAEQLCRQEGDLNTLRVVLGNQALVLQSKGRLREAMKRHKEQERLCRQLGSLSGLAVALGNQAHILRAWHDPDGAMALHKQAELVCRQLGTPEGLATALANQALLLWTVRPQEALPLAEEALEIATRHEITSLIRQLRPFVEDVRSEAKPGGFP